jgi:lipoprotein-releasing system permease protein
MNVSSFIAQKISLRGNGFTGFIVRLASTTIALCFVVMILASSMVRGFKDEISRKVFSFWGHLHIGQVNARQDFTGARPFALDSILWQRMKNLSSLSEEDFQDPPDYLTLPSKGGVKFADPIVHYSGIAKGKEEVEGLFLKGVSKEYNPDFFKEFLTQGRDFSTFSSAMAEKRPIVLSEWVAARLQLSVGQELVVYFVKEDRQVARKFEVIGLFNTGLLEYDSKFALVSIQDLQDILGWSFDQITHFEIHLEHLEDLDAYHHYAYYEFTNQYLTAESVRYKFPTIFDWLDLQDINEKVIVLLMLIVCLVNMGTTVLVLILERTNMIGVLKALGMRNLQIRQIFVLQAMRVLFWGLLIGNGMGILLGLLQDYFRVITLDESSYYLSYAPIEFNFPFLIFLNLLTVALTFLFLLVPTLWITKIQAVKAIQYK